MRHLIRSLAVLAMVGGLAACSQGSDSGGGADVGVEAPRDGTVADQALPEAGGSGESTTQDREVVITGSMTVTVDDAVEAGDEAQRIVEAAGGRVDAYSQQTPYEDIPVSVYLTVRIPSEDLTPTLEELEALGDVEDLSLNRQDVTLQVTDLDARIESLLVSIDRLQTLMSQATTTADLLEAEAALTERQAELDSLNAQKAYLSEQVDLATISLSLIPEDVAPEPEPAGFWGGVQKGWAALVTAFNALLVVLGALLPWALLAAVIGGIVVLIRRLIPRRPKPSRPAPMPPHGPVPPGPGPAYPMSSPQQYGPPQGPVPPQAPPGPSTPPIQGGQPTQGEQPPQGR